MKQTKNRSQTFAFVLLIICLCIIVTLCLFSYKYPNTPAFVMYIIASVTAIMMLCANFLFSSTQGSQAKDAANKDTMDNLVTQLGNSTPIPLSGTIPATNGAVSAPNIPPIAYSPLTIEQLIAACKDLPSLEALLPKVQINGIPQTVTDLYNAKKIELTK